MLITKSTVSVVPQSLDILKIVRIKGQGTVRIRGLE